MAQWDSEPDPYTYTPGRADFPWNGNRRCYIVSRDGKTLGVIVPVWINTDTKIGRLRRQGRGRNGFAAVVPNRHGFTGARLAGFGTYMERDRRRDAAADLEHRILWGGDYNPEFIGQAVAHYADPVTPSKENQP